MIYTDYMRRKMHNIVKLDTAEGYPLTVYSCANKNLKDYTITGNTVYSENLFNYTEPYNDNQIIADEDGWFDVTIDNTEGTSTAFKSCVTKVNNALKPDTEYILFTEIAECTGTINVQVKTASSNSQFTGASIRYDIAGTRSATITTFSSFDNCTQMLSSTCYCGAGRSGHAKFRIAVYETQKDVFLPYSKQSVGDLVTDETSEYYEKYDVPITVCGKNLLPNDWESGFISISSGANQSASTYVRTKDYFTFDISKNYYISSDSIDTRATISWYFYDENKNFIGRFVSYKNRTIGTSGCQVTIPTNTVFFRLAVLTTDINIKVQIEEGSTATSYEPYHEPVTTNIFRDAQLGQGESINYKSDNLPDITLKKGTNIITADTEVKPSNIKIKYLKK